MTVNYEVYNSDKQNFFSKHNKSDWRVDTSPMDEYGVYFKNYYFDDGAVWSERMEVKTIPTEVEVKMVKVMVEVELQEIEYWSTESSSKYYYERV